MKKLSSLLAGLIATLAVTAQDTQPTYTIDGLTYRIEESWRGVHATVVDADPDLVNVYIPSYITIDGNDFKVAVVARGAFAGHTELRTVQLGDVTFLDYIENDEWHDMYFYGDSIEPQGCFEGCTSLEYIDLSNVQSITYDCFKGCTSLKSVYAPNLTLICSRAFVDCSALETVTIGKPDVTTAFVSDVVTGDDMSFFKNCASLQSLSLLSDPYNDDNGPLTTNSRTDWTACLPPMTITDCPLLNELTAPSITLCHTNAVNNAPSLKKLDLGSANYMRFAKDAFTQCCFDEIVCRFPMPPRCPSAGSPFDVAENGFKVTIPKGSSEYFAADSFWGQFETLVEDENILSPFSYEYLPGNSMKSYGYTLNDDKMSVGYRWPILGYVKTDATGFPWFSNSTGNPDTEYMPYSYDAPLTYTQDDITYPVTAVAPYACSWGSQTYFNAIILHDGITRIGHGAFSNIRLNPYDDWIAEPYGIFFGRNVTDIERNAFCNLSLRRPTTFTLPASLKHIGPGVFSKAKGITGFTSLALTPPTIDDDTFFTDAATRNSITVSVPTDAVEAYKAAEYWRDFNITTLDGPKYYMPHYVDVDRYGQKDDMYNFTVEICSNDLMSTSDDLLERIVLSDFMGNRLDADVTAKLHSRLYLTFTVPAEQFDTKKHYLITIPEGYIRDRDYVISDGRTGCQMPEFYIDFRINKYSLTFTSSKSGFDLLPEDVRFALNEKNGRITATLDFGAKAISSLTGDITDKTVIYYNDAPFQLPYQIFASSTATGADGIAQIHIDKLNRSDRNLTLTLEPEIFSWDETLSDGATVTHYSPELIYEFNPSLLGVESIEADIDSEVIYYNLQGIRVTEPGHGTYIRVSGNRADKVRL